MIGISLGHILLLAVIVLLFGPKRVSALGANMGKMLRDLRKNIGDASDDMGVTDLRQSWQEVSDEVRNLKQQANPLSAAKDASAPKADSPSDPSLKQEPK